MPTRFYFASFERSERGKIERAKCPRDFIEGVCGANVLKAGRLIMIHKFSLFGTNVVVDVNSGAVHIFDDIAYDVLDYYENNSHEKIIEELSTKYKSEEIGEAIKDIDSLKAEGMLYSEDVYKETVSLWDQKPVVKALCLHISHDCNLRCKYCFASTGDFGGQRTMMSYEVGDRKSVV